MAYLALALARLLRRRLEATTTENFVLIGGAAAEVIETLKLKVE